MSIDVRVATDAEAAGEAVAASILELVRQKPDAAIGVATGSSPEPVYTALARRAREEADFSRVRWFALDEYLGLPAGHPQSYRVFLERWLIEPLGLDPANLFVPDGTSADPDAAARAYEKRVTAAHIDLQLLGIGENGHIGFNEPGTPLSATTHRAALSASTRQANARFFDTLDDVPRECLTQGLATILRAARIELIACGPRKASAIAEAVHGPVTPACPASVLATHPRVRFTLDPAAAAMLLDAPALR